MCGHNGAAVISPTSPLLVVCLCAAWCGVCREYRPRFDAIGASLQAELPGLRWRWIDVEDDEDLLHPLQVDDFPTLLIVRDGAPLFCAPVPPLAGRLERLVRTLATQDYAPVLADAVVRQAAQRVFQQSLTSDGN